MTECAHVYHIYYRVLIWHAVSFLRRSASLHTSTLCVHSRVPTLVSLRRHAVSLHILAAAAFGGWNWGSISTACVTHSLLKLLRVIVDARIGHPPRSSSSVLRSGSKLISASGGAARGWRQSQTEHILVGLGFAILPVAFVVQMYLSTIGRKYLEKVMMCAFGRVSDGAPHTHAAPQLPIAQLQLLLPHTGTRR